MRVACRHRLFVVLTTVLALALVAAANSRMVTAQAPQQADLAVPDLAEAIVIGVLEDRQTSRQDGSTQPFQRLSMRLTDGSRAGEVVEVENGQFAGENVQRYRVGDRLMLMSTAAPDGTKAYYVADVVRRDALLILTVVFVALTVAIGRSRGAASLLGLSVSFVVIFAFVLPRIAAGDDPLVVTIAASAVIIPVTFYLSHGANRKTTAAVAGTLIALAVTGLIATFATNMAMLTGQSSEEAMYLQATAPSGFDMHGLLLASIVIGLLGVLDDVTISQAAVVNQLRESAPNMVTAEVIRRAMDVGTDHIASLVNTLVLVYASSAMPLLLLFTSGSAPVREILNYEIVAEEIVRTLVASIGLILAVPITTVVAAIYIRSVRDATPTEA